MKVTRFAQALVFIAVLAVVAGCVGNGGGSTGTGRDGPPDTSVSPEAVARYGEAAQQNPPGITYQPDVVVVGGGAGVVRSVSDDGLQWTVDSDAEGLSELDEGEVLFLTSRAAGRVVTKESSNGAVVLTLAPVQLQEIIRDGRLEYDSAIDPGNVSYQEIPGMHGTVSVPDQKDAVVPAAFEVGRPQLMPAVYHAEPWANAIHAPSGVLPPPANSAESVIGRGRWQATTTANDEGLTVGVSAKPSPYFKVGVTIALAFKRLQVRGRLALTDGNPDGPPTILVEGINVVAVNVWGGVGQGGSSNNRKMKIEFPVELANTPINVDGIPMVFNLKVSVFVETGLSGNNSTITANGKWGLEGPIGIRDGTGVVPKYRVINSIMKSIGGLAVGPSGVVFGADVKAMVGVGVPGLSAGPYVKFKVSAGVANGSALGAALARCTQADLLLKGGGGVGLSLTNATADAMKTAIPRLPAFTNDLALEKLWTIKESHQIVPDVPLCKTG